MSAATGATEPETPGTETRASVFLSYTKADAAVAEKLRAFLHRDGIDCWRDKDSLEAGDDWQAEILAEIERRMVFLVLFTSSAGRSKWVQQEIDFAQDAYKEVWVIQDGSAEVDFLEKRNLLNEHTFPFTASKEQNCFDQILARINARWPPRHHVYSGRITSEYCPYPGTLSFKTEKEGEMFFGRERAANKLMRMIEKGNQRVILVHGPSGAGKTSLLEVGMRRKLPNYCKYLRIEGDTPDDLLRSVAEGLSGSPASPALDVERQIVSAIEKGRHNKYILCFDQMESFFVNGGKDTVAEFLSTLRNILAVQHSKRVTILISFRNDFLADVQRRIREFFSDEAWSEVAIWKLSVEDARECILRPARKCDVFFEEELADKLLEALKQENGGEPIVNPMDLQKVCQKLWLEVAALTPLGRQWSIDGRVLRRLSNAERGFSSEREYVETVLRKFLHDKIEEIAKGLGKPEQYARLALMQFVGPKNERLTVAEEANGDVGKLPSKVVQQLVNSGLVQTRAVRKGLRQYELCHDSLAEEIARHVETDDAIFAVRSLDAALARESPKEWKFNRHSDLLERLETVQGLGWRFDEAEAEFLLRSGLGDKRTVVKASNISLDKWAAILGKLHPATLAKVLIDALQADREESVQLDAINLLLNNSTIREALELHLGGLGQQLENLSIEIDLDKSVKAKACEALVVLGQEKRIKRLFEYFAKKNTRPVGRTALALTKDVVEKQTEGPVGPSDTVVVFGKQWKALSFASQFSITNELFQWRWQNSYGWILFLIALASPAGAVGAIIPFLFVGPLGASLTMGTRQMGAAIGIFHGFAGGLIWGLGVSTGFLLYGVIWRGGVIRGNAMEKFGFMFSAMLGAALGGLTNSAVISFVFEPTGLVNAGWLTYAKADSAERFNEIFLGTMHGWVMPIFGAALGLGIAWSLLAILADPKERWIEREHSAFGIDPADSTGPIRVRSTLKNIVLRVCVRESWRNILCLSAGAFLIFHLIKPAIGVCDHRHSEHYEVRLSDNTLKTQDDTCEKDPLLPGKEWRTAGLAAVILGGSLGQEILFLFGLLTVQYGLEIKRLRENRRFLRSSEVNL